MRTFRAPGAHIGLNILVVTQVTTDILIEGQSKDPIPAAHVLCGSSRIGGTKVLGKNWETDKKQPQTLAARLPNAFEIALDIGAGFNS